MLKVKNSMDGVLKAMTGKHVSMDVLYDDMEGTAKKIFGNFSEEKIGDSELDSQLSVVKGEGGKPNTYSPKILDLANAVATYLATVEELYTKHNGGKLEPDYVSKRAKQMVAGLEEPAAS
jgi:hypothetical protein